MTVPTLYTKLKINVPTSLSAISLTIDFSLASYSYIFDTLGNTLAIPINNIMTGTHDCNPLGYFVSFAGFDAATGIDTDLISWEDASTSTTVSVINPLSKNTRGLKIFRNQDTGASSAYLVGFSNMNMVMGGTGGIGVIELDINYFTCNP